MSAYIVRTDEGAFVEASQPPNDTPLTKEQAEASAKRRNAKAEEFGIKTRYVVEESD